MIIALFSFAPKNYSIFFYESQNNLNSNYFKIKINDVINFLNLEETKVDIKTKNKITMNKNNYLVMNKNNFLVEIF